MVLFSNNECVTLNSFFNENYITLKLLIYNI